MDNKSIRLLNILNEVTRRYEELFYIKEKILQESEYKATHDLLTDLYNKEAFKKKVTSIIKKDTKFMLVFLDLDNFKNVNDVYGHDMGDKILMEVSRILKETLKGKDIVSRFGGDEFVFALLECNKECAKILLEKIKSKINTDLKDYEIGASIGGASFPYEADNLDELLAIADKKMYISKNKGKNQITL